MTPAANAALAPEKLKPLCRRRLPSPPVPAINLDQYAELARLAANLNQLARAANEGRPVTVDAALLQRLAGEVGRLRLALIGAGGRE